MRKSSFNLKSMRGLKQKEMPLLEKRIHPKPCRTRGMHRLEAPPDRSIGIIGEIKKSSPSEGNIKSISIEEQVHAYASAGVRAVSVLTDGNYFSGSWEDLFRAASLTDLPVLCKEFIFFPEQLRAALIFGADLVLLIARVLPPEELRRLYTEAMSLNMTPLIEVHHQDELSIVLDLYPEFIMVNMRNLETLEIDRPTGTATLNKIPDGITKVCASGISGKDDIRSVYEETGARLYLVGTALMRSGDPLSFIRELCDVH